MIELEKTTRGNNIFLVMAKVVPQGQSCTKLRCLIRIDYTMLLHSRAAESESVGVSNFGRSRSRSRIDEVSPTPTPARIASESIGCVSRMPFCYGRQRQSLSETVLTILFNIYVPPPSAIQPLFCELVSL